MSLVLLAKAEPSRFALYAGNASWMLGVVSLFAVLLWKGEFSFFDSLKEKGRVKGVRLWLIPLVPSVILGAGSLIESPGSITGLVRMMLDRRAEAAQLCALGISFLSALCVLPAFAKTIGDNVSSRWFIALLTLFFFQDSLVGAAFGKWVSSGLSINSEQWAGAFPSLTILSIMSPVLTASALLLTLLWSGGDIRAAISLSVSIAIQRFFAPTFSTAFGLCSHALAVFALWLAVGGIKQFRRYRATVAQAEMPEV